MDSCTGRRRVSLIFFAELAMMRDVVKVIEAISALEPRVAAFAVLALVVVAVLLIATK